MLKLVPPGQRKGNKFFLIVGTFKGKYIERSTKTYDELEALRAKARLEIRLIDDYFSEQHKQRLAAGLVSHSFPWATPPHSPKNKPKNE